MTPTAGATTPPVLGRGFTAAGRRRRTARYAAVTLTLALAAAGLCWACLMTGETRYTASQVLAVIAGHRVPGASFTVGELRLPRALLGLLAGLSFGMAGTASQTMLRNQLASPDIIGITSGASAAAVFSILVLGWSGSGVNALAVIAGLATALVTIMLSGSGTTQGGRLILIGIGISAMLSSVIAYLQLRASVYNVSDALRWLSGSLSSARWEQVPVLAAALVACGALLLHAGRDLRVLPLGDEAATGLGVPVRRTRILLLLTVVALSAFATAATGPIAFVSFLAGPITARLIGRSDQSPLVPSALTGAVLVLAADLAGRSLFPTALPVGVVTGVVGAPYLMVQLIRINRQGASA